MVLIAAIEAHCKFCHSSSLPIVGDTLDNGETRTTISAVYERIKIAAVIRVQELSQTFSARRYVRRDFRLRTGFTPACNNAETLFVIQRQNGSGNMFYMRLWRRR